MEAEKIHHQQHHVHHHEDASSKRRKELFGDCALIEIIHLHDCLRGALRALESDVNDLACLLQQQKDEKQQQQQQQNHQKEKLFYTKNHHVTDLERKVASRFKVIWSVFRAHSSAEDEFIWPALQSKTQGRVRSGKQVAGETPNDSNNNNNNNTYNNVIPVPDAVVLVEQEQYEEDHADEERMFSQMDTLLAKLRKSMVQDVSVQRSHSSLVDDLVNDLSHRIRNLSQHLMVHLEKEETQCMPLVVQHLSKSEIHELVGKIMGKRSADTIAEIMTMAVQNLDQDDREEMVKYMKQSMAGTFFDRWLQMSGWGTQTKPEQQEENIERLDQKRSAENLVLLDSKRRQVDYTEENEKEEHTNKTKSNVKTPLGVSITSQNELEKLIRAIASNPALSAEQKNTTIQGLRDSVWKSNMREKERNLLDSPTVVNATVPLGPSFMTQRAGGASESTPASISNSSRTRRVTPPSMYFKKDKNGKVDQVWNSDTTSPSSKVYVPLFSASELAPTYHDGAAGAALGCPHYARACKLRHPKSGRLYTCRLCCDQERELPMRDQDDPLDRYEVSEVMCMKCNALQPAEDRCLNRDCESRGKPFAKYFCRICHLYDDGSRSIFHCPYCNICRLGLGLGIDFRHCMRCNACVSLTDTEHQCIPQKLQGNCPICRESLFQSTEPLRGLKCGHVMHLQCFTEYRRCQCYTCPLCMRSMEDMKEVFTLLDTAIRMQPMPQAYLSTMSNIYCQDCAKTGTCRYHFVGQKCPHCGSYNTRELGRLHNSPPQSPTLHPG